MAAAASAVCPHGHSPCRGQYCGQQTHRTPQRHAGRQSCGLQHHEWQRSTAASQLDRHTWPRQRVFEAFDVEAFPGRCSVPSSMHRALVRNTGPYPCALAMAACSLCTAHCLHRSSLLSPIVCLDDTPPLPRSDILIHHVAQHSAPVLSPAAERLSASILHLARTALENCHFDMSPPACACAASPVCRLVRGDQQRRCAWCSNCRFKIFGHG